MKIAFIYFALILSVASLHSASLEINVKLLEDEIIVGMPVYLEATVLNTSLTPIEVPKLKAISIGEIGLCRNILAKSDGERPTPKEFERAALLDDRMKAPIPTEILQPGETRIITFPLGYAVEPLDLTFRIECEFYKDPKEYEKHLYLLDHAIHSGTYKSNDLIITINSPQGVDLEVFTKYLKGRPLWVVKGKNKGEMEIITKYPESKYAISLLCRNPYSQIEYVKKYNPREFVQNIVNRKPWLNNHPKAVQGRKESKHDVQTMLTVINCHKNSQCRLYYMLSSAKKLINLGEFKDATSLLDEVVSTKTIRALDNVVKEKAQDYLCEMEKHGVRQ